MGKGKSKSKKGGSKKGSTSAPQVEPVVEGEPVVDEPVVQQPQRGEYDVRYIYNTITGHGEVEALLNMPILVQTGSANQSRARSVHIRHPNIWPTLWTHPYRSNEENTLYHPYKHTLHDYVESNRGTSNQLVMTYTVPSNSTQKITYQYVPDNYRSLIRDAIRGIIHLHAQHLSLSALSLNNNFVIDDYGLHLFQLDYGPSTTKDQTNDFVLLEKVLQELFQGWGMPIDVEHLCVCMRNYTPGVDEFLLLNHLAVLGTTIRTETIRAFYENRNLISPYQAYTDIFDVMIYEDWTVRLDRLEWGPVQDCFNRLAPNTNIRVYDIPDVNDANHMNFTAIRMSRNMASHLLEYSRFFNQADIDLIIMAAFGNHLLSFQKEAHELDLLCVLTG